MFSQQQLIQLEYALKYVLQDLEYDINATKDGQWRRELCDLLAAVQAEQQHEAS
mgnify:CR=1 FL=1